MIDIPLNKTLTAKKVIKLGIDICAGKTVVAVELEKDRIRDCRECVFFRLSDCYKKFACNSSERKDGKDVIFKLVDLPEEGSDDSRN